MLTECFHTCSLINKCWFGKKIYTVSDLTRFQYCNVKLFCININNTIMVQKHHFVDVCLLCLKLFNVRRSPKRNLKQFSWSNIIITMDQTCQKRNAISFFIENPQVGSRELTKISLSARLLF